MLKTLLPLTLLTVLAFAQPAAAQQAYWWQGHPDARGGYYNDQVDVTDQYESTYGPDPYASRGAPYVSRQDRFDEDQYRAYRREMARRYHRDQYDNGYAPDAPPPQNYGYNNDSGAVPYAAPVYPVQPQSKAMAQSKPVVKKKPVIDAAKPATTTTSTASSASTPVTTGSTSTAVASTAPAAAATPPATASTGAAPPPAATATASTPATPVAKKGGTVTCDKGASIVSSFGFEKVANKSCAGTSLVYSAERGGKPFEIEVNPKSGELTAVKKL